MLKITQEEVRLITDVNISLIVKKGIRGGRCEPLHINAKANNILIKNLIKKKRILKVI